ncbi:testis-specific gene 13 protein isoform X3 [Cricetulus griseus]|uniref:Testis-specific gene 13 protein isoform X3 n=1 Tax=Cricetulus griseus TaxID=10029 RepID=A0A9J7HAS1_CRIGR|nr:testis-specific gene 13 protein isoform X3 [Cricetulus griseus]
MLEDCRIPGPAIKMGWRKVVLALEVSASLPSALLMEFNLLLPGQDQPVLGDPWVTDQPLPPVHLTSRHFLLPQLLSLPALLHRGRPWIPVPLNCVQNVLTYVRPYIVTSREKNLHSKTTCDIQIILPSTTPLLRDASACPGTSTGTERVGKKLSQPPWSTEETMDGHLCREHTDISTALVCGCGQRALDQTVLTVRPKETPRALGTEHLLWEVEELEGRPAVCSLKLQGKVKEKTEEWWHVYHPCKHYLGNKRSPGNYGLLPTCTNPNMLDTTRYGLGRRWRGPGRG